MGGGGGGGVGARRAGPRSRASKQAAAAASDSGGVNHQIAPGSAPAARSPPLTTIQVPSDPGSRHCGGRHNQCGGGGRQAQRSTAPRTSPLPSSAAGASGPQVCAADRELPDPSRPPLRSSHHVVHQEVQPRAGRVPAAVEAAEAVGHRVHDLLGGGEGRKEAGFVWGQAGAAMGAQATVQPMAQLAKQLLHAAQPAASPCPPLATLSRSLLKPKRPTYSAAGRRQRSRNACRKPGRT
jgi:hypothetical protein